MKRSANPAGAVDATIARLFASVCQGRRATDQHRWAAMRHVTYIILLAVAGLAGCTKETHMSSQHIEWPVLTNYPCTAGRAATSNDVNEGRAVFVLQADGQSIGQPLEIGVPQYAFHIDERTKQRTPCVIIQAEEARGQRLVGCRTLPDGMIMAALFHEFEMLGERPGGVK